MHYVIICFIYIITLNSALAQTRIAKITTSIAVVYKDPHLKFPKGYMRVGKKIQIGKSIDEKRIIYPLIVEGKRAYIHIKDISILNQHTDNIKKVREHNFEYVGLDQYDLNKKMSSLMLTYGTGGAGVDWNNLGKFMGDKNFSNITSLGLSMIYHPVGNRFFFGAGLKHISIDQRSVSLTSTMISISSYYNIYHNDKINFLFKLSFLFSGDIQINSSYDSTPSRGLAMGGDAGIMLRFFPQSKWGTMIGITTQKISLSEIEPVINQFGQAFHFDKILGTSIYAGLSYHF